MEVERKMIVGRVAVEGLASAPAGCRRVDWARRHTSAAAGLELDLEELDLEERDWNWSDGCVLDGGLDVAHCEMWDVTFLVGGARELC